MTDIVEKLSKYVADMGTRNPKDYTAFLTVEDAAEAIKTIEKLRAALHKIGYDYVEFSHEKVQMLYLEHISIARKAYQESFPEQRASERRIFYIDVGNMPTIKAEQYLRDIMNKYRNKLVQPAEKKPLDNNF